MAALSQRVIWTALPKSVGREGVQVSVFVSPRLTVGGRTSVPLKSFPLWLDWPAVVARATFEVQIGRKRFRGKPVSRPDSRIWAAIFGSETIVRGHAPEDLTDRRLIAYPMAEMQARLRRTYVDVASRFASEPPRPNVLEEALEEYARLPPGPDLLKTLAGPNGNRILKELGKRADLALFRAYHTPLSAPPGDRPGSREAAALIKGIDFHRLVSAIGQHAALLRATGLVVDLVLDDAPPPGEAPMSVAVRWHQGRGVETRPDGRPELQVRVDEERFEAVADTRRIAGRRLDLSDPRFAPVQVDVDGGIIKLSGTGASMVSRRQRADANGGKTAADAEPVGLPTLRSTGIVIAEAGRADTLAALLARSARFEEALTGDKPILLHAEDVNRGYHVDVWTEGTWRSLCEIEVGYRMPESRQELRDPDAEGLVQLGVGEAPPGAPAELSKVMRLGEGLFNWDGWSLAAPRPGLGLDKDGRPRRDPETGGLPVDVSARAKPGSLPRLRFGATYRMRVRLADLAHNAEAGDARDDKDPTGVSAPITYRRFEPLAPPVPALVETGGIVDVPEAGASLLRMVIRSRDGQLQTPTGDTDARLFLPPRASAEMAERHGVLDGADGRPRGDLYPRLQGQDGDLAEVSGGPGGERRYPAAPHDIAVAPWLPDPAAERVRVLMLPDRPRRMAVGQGHVDSEAYAEIPADAAWPEHRPWTIRLIEDPQDPLRFVPRHDTDFDLSSRSDWDPATRVLSVALPKGETLTATLSHMFSGKPEPADLWGLAAWMRDELGPDIYQGVALAINAGRHWAITPALKIELVHAAQRPLVRPDPTIQPVSRTAGDTAAALSLNAPCHAESTGSLALEGRWIEARDDGTAAPGAGWRAGTAFRHELADTDTPGGSIGLAKTHAFGDTLYRRVRYRMVGASRFAEYFTAETAQDAEATRLATPDVIVHVPNAAPPPPPKVVRTVPVFDWLRDTAGNYKASWRRAGLRVFLDRPWFQTGFGEMLAAVLPRPGTTGQPSFERLAPHLSLWSGDPVWKPWSGGAIDDLNPGLSAFSARARPGDGPDPRWPDFFPMPERALAGGNPRYENLALPDEAGNVIGHVDAAGHPVGWDAETGLYHADLMIAPGRAYQPFLRLAVARLHPISAEGCHLSPPVALDMTQILPERLAIARKSGSQGWLVQIYGTLHAERDTAHDDDRPYQNVVRMEVQRTAYQSPDELDWETVEDAQIADGPEASSVLQNVTFAMPSSYTGASLFPGKSGALFEAASDFVATRPEPIYSTYVKTPGAGGGDRDGKRWRIRITEWERHSADHNTGTVRDTPGEHERLVFAETFEV